MKKIMNNKEGSEDGDSFLQIIDNALYRNAAQIHNTLIFSRTGS